MTNINIMSPSSGRMLREDNSYINQANYYAPIPNGDEIITATEAGVKTLAPPNSDSIRAFVGCTVPIYIRFGADPSMGIGVLCESGGNIELESAEEISQCKIYATGAGTIFVQYLK